MATKTPAVRKAAAKSAAGKSSKNSNGSGLTKAAFVDLLAGTFELPKNKAGDVLDFVVENIKKAVKKQGALTVAGLGTFKIAKRAARTGRNPQTGASIKVKASKTVRFKPAPVFKNDL